MEGWIKLHRKSLESTVFYNANTWKVFCYCLMRANHKPTKTMFEGKEVEIQPGQFITGRFAGAEDCNMSPSTYRNQITKLKELNILDIKSDNKKSLISIVNWGTYQSDEINQDMKPDNRRTTKGHRQECKNERNKYSIKNMPENIGQELFYKNNFFYVTITLKNELLRNIQGLTEDRLITEFYKMAQWLSDNKGKNDYKRFITNWLSRIDYNKAGASNIFSFNPVEVNNE